MISTTPWSIFRAAPDEAHDAFSIMLEVSQWVADMGHPLWPVESIRLETFRRAALAGELVLGYQGSVAVASMLLQTRDEFYWPSDAPGEALYLHKIAVRRSAAGQGWSGRLIRWAHIQARIAGARFLRIDTADQSALLSIYHRHGFHIVDDEPRQVGHLSVYRLEMPLMEMLP